MGIEEEDKISKQQSKLQIIKLLENSQNYIHNYVHNYIHIHMHNHNGDLTTL